MRSGYIERSDLVASHQKLHNWNDANFNESFLSFYISLNSMNINKLRTDISMMIWDIFTLCAFTYISIFVTDQNAQNIIFLQIPILHIDSWGWTQTYSLTQPNIRKISHTVANIRSETACKNTFCKTYLFAKLADLRRRSSLLSPSLPFLFPFPSLYPSLPSSSPRQHVEAFIF